MMPQVLSFDADNNQYQVQLGSELFNVFWFSITAEEEPKLCRTGAWWPVEVDDTIKQAVLRFSKFGSNSPVCECGADKCKLPFHSQWCNKYGY